MGKQDNDKKRQRVSSLDGKTETNEEAMDSQDGVLFSLTVAEYQVLIAKLRNLGDKHKASNNRILNLESRLDEAQAEIDPLSLSCEGTVSEDEFLRALKEFKNCKSPVKDGFSAAFYNFFWSEICTDMIASFNFAFKSGMLSISQRRGIISLIPKKNKDKNKKNKKKTKTNPPPPPQKKKKKKKQGQKPAGKSQTHLAALYRLQNFDKIHCEKVRKSASKNHQP